MTSSQFNDNSHLLPFKRSTKFKMADNNKLRTSETVEEIVIDFGEICRFCLAETTSNISIQDNCVMNESMEIPRETIFGFVTKLTSIKLENTDNFPSLVCESCYELIKICYNFSQVCLQSDQSLRDCYEKTLQATKAKLNCETCDDPDKNSSSEVKTEDVLVKMDLLVDDSSSKLDNFYLSEVDKSISNDLKWEPIVPKDLNVIKADNIKEKYPKISSLSERLKEAQSKLAEDILRSNDMMLGLPGSDELSKALSEERSSYDCPQCSLNFNNAEGLKFHYIATHGHVRNLKTLTKFQCRMCAKFFGEKERLIRHYESVHNMDESKLLEGDLNHKFKKSIRSGRRKFYCLHCVPYKIFQTRDELVEHLAEFHKMKEKVTEIAKSYACKHCETETTFPTRLSLNCHLRTAHKVRGDEAIVRDVTCVSKDGGDSEVTKTSNLKLFKVFVCIDCSPPVSYTSVNAYLQHKVESHDKQLENIPLKELTPVYVDSLDVFKQSGEDTSGFRFKVLCKNCNPAMEFTTASAFIDHMYSEHDETTLENWDIESKHLPEGTDEGKKDTQWKCTECPATYFRRQSLYYHMKDKHKKQLNPGAMKCPEPDCSETFFTNRQLIQHGIGVHQKYFAHFHKIFKKKILQSSSEEDNRVKNFECDICQKKYVCKNSLKRHILKTHLGRVETETVVCPHCGKTLSNKLNLKSHIEFVHEALFVSCPVCKKNINFRTIGKHYKTHQTNQALVDAQNQFLCNLCGKILKSKRGFEDHQKLHKNIRDQLCDICGSGFTTKKFLHLHKKTHEGIHRKVFECHQCDKVFSGRHTLNRHLLTHSGEKNFICEICSKCFYTLQELNRHVRYHKKEYRFDCQLCDMRFLDKSRFRHHMMRHRNIRPHKCQFCDKMFIVRRKMNLHMAAKHNVEIQSTKAVWKDPKTYIPLDDLL